MNALIQMTTAHPIVSIWLAMTMSLWLTIYLSTRTKSTVKKTNRRR